MPTLIVASRTVSYDQALAAAARFAGWAVLTCDSNSIPARVDDPVVFVTTDLILPVIDNLRLALLEPTFDLLTRVPEKLLCRTVELATFADLERLQGPTFVKPADPLDKWFDPGVYSDVHDIRTRGRISPESPVLLSEPVQWSTEYRYFVLLNERDRRINSVSPLHKTPSEVIAGSPYLAFGRPAWKPFDPKQSAAIPNAGLAVVERLCAAMRHDLPPAFVVDVGMIEESGWAIVEFNPVWSAGLLGADPRAVLHALRRVTRKRDELSESDARWVVDRN
jgi:ATP-grasp domain, R2K clade family 2